MSTLLGHTDLKALLLQPSCPAAHTPSYISQIQTKVQQCVTSAVLQFTNCLPLTQNQTNYLASFPQVSTSHVLLRTNDNRFHYNQFDIIISNISLCFQVV